MKIHSYEDLLKHNQNKDCWLLISGKVYDVTEFMDDYPGGDQVLLTASGKDATENGHYQSRDLLLFSSKFKSGNLKSSNLWLCVCMRRDEDASSSKKEGGNKVRMFGSDEDFATKVPTQAQPMVEGSGSLMVSEFKPSSDVDYLQELLAIQQQGPRAIGFFGTQNMGFMHQQLIEILSYAMVITKNHIYTSGASGTNAAV